MTALFMKVIALCHIPLKIIVLILHENPRVV